MKVTHIQVFNLNLIGKVLFYTGLWNLAYCKMNIFWKIQISIKAEGTQVVTSLFSALARILVWNFGGRHQLKCTLELCYYVDANYHVMPIRQSFTNSPRNCMTNVWSDKTALDENQSIFLWRVHRLDLSVPRGSLVAVVGEVGSGKSSLISAILGEMTRISGKRGVTVWRHEIEAIKHVSSSP